MKWHRISIKTDREKTGLISERLIACGCGGVQTEDPFETEALIREAGAEEYADPGLMPPDTEHVITTCYFDIGTDIAPIASMIADEFDIQSGQIFLSEADDSEWEGSWKKYYRQIYVGNNLLISPAWQKVRKGNKRKVIFMDPGMAFGSGQHETTFMCAEILDTVIRGGERVLDIGTGSGILAVISAKLGAVSVTALDIDPIALKTAEENIRLNGCGDIVSVDGNFPGSLKGHRYDIIVANIVTGTLIDMKDDIRRMMMPEGTVILSGIIRDKLGILLEEYMKSGFRLRRAYNKNEWMALELYA